MLYYLFEYLDQYYDIPELYQFITFRAGIAVIISLIISLLFGKQIINFLKKQQVGETIRDLGLDGQMEKAGTPTMGGVIIVMAILIPCLLVARLDNIYIIVMLISTIWMAAVGFMDDYIKVFKKDKKGLHGKFKILGQVTLGIIIGLTMLWSNDIVVSIPAEEAKNYDIQKTYERVNPLNRTDTTMYAYVKAPLTNVPFLKGEYDYTKVFWFLDYNTAKKFVSVLYILIVILIITSVSNAANLTDGIDGLATGISAIIGASLGILAYVSGNSIAAEYLDILYLPHTGELLVFSAAFLGACIGFLWYNAYPAQVFMGDTGSLALGSIIAAMALLIRKELLIPILCGVFLMETLSVMMQVSYFKYTRKKYGEGRRIFLMSPLHHHYQKKGIPEPKIVTRFWIVSILLAVFTIITLKIR